MPGTTPGPAKVDALSAAILAIHDVDCDSGTDCTEIIDQFGRYGRYAKAVLEALGIDPRTPVTMRERPAVKRD
jgi:hypothetical protein